MFPLRGQILRARHAGEPRISQAHEGEDHLVYIISRREDVILGGTLQKDNWSTDASASDTQNILKNCAEMNPHFTKPEVLEVKVGLRPGRTEVRLEAEEFYLSGANRKVVIHNYGHGGSGYTLCWGCALEAVALVEQQARRVAVVCRL